MFSKACEYGIRALIYIAARHEQGVERVGIKEIASKIDIPERFTSNILQNLVKNDLANSSKGPNGGYYIEKDRKITLWDVVLQVDGEKGFTECALGLKECSETEPCPIHGEISKARLHQINMLQESEIHDLANDLLKGNVYLSR